MGSSRLDFPGGTAVNTERNFPASRGQEQDHRLVSGGLFIYKEQITKTNLIFFLFNALVVAAYLSLWVIHHTRKLLDKFKNHRVP